ncbi:MAG: phosphonate ABC transporter ATP-binding protein [Erysipelotrichaceae bacterium]|jgi:phosphonate transport system ATP-binding protein|nr:phosphonate ABC transporter ATP-binding protein [Erysipelotrichaceae bacterium]
MIEFKNVVKTYPGNVKALQGVSCQIQQGEFVAIIGLSGAGKSTFIRCINQMHTITSGEIIVNDENVTALKGNDLRHFRRKIGMVFQSFNLVKRTTVIKNVLTARVADMSLWKSLLGLYTKEDKILALTALDNVGILDKAYLRADTLSGGQAQRVALARCLAQKPDIILADEPVASLDPLTSQQVMEDFVKINKEFNITVVANMHHVDIAQKYAQRIIGIKAGKIVFDGPSQSLTNDDLTNIYGRSLQHDEIKGLE